MNKYDRRKLAFTKKSSELFAYISGIFLCISTVFMFANMLTRTVANYNIRFVYDLCSLCAAGVASFAIPYATLKSAHTAMDIITGHLSPRVRAACEAISGVITAVVMIFTVYVLLNYAYQRTLVLESTTTSGFPTFIFRWIYAAGMLFTLVAGVIETIDMFRIAAGKDVVLAQEEAAAPELQAAEDAPQLTEDAEDPKTEDKGEEV